MAKISEDTFQHWSKPPSDTEGTKLENAERMVKEAINADPELSKKSIKVFGQGSYANDTNIRADSDVDVNVRLNDVFYFDIPKDKNRSDYGLNSPSSYTFLEFKNSVEIALVNKFGREEVIRDDKCLTVTGNTYRIKADVVPTFLYKRYEENGSVPEGVEFKTDEGKYIINYPLRHLENGCKKNANTGKAFKRTVRIFKRLRNKMCEDGIGDYDTITSFLNECLIWNVPDPIFNSCETWTEVVRKSIVHLFNATKAEEDCKEWGEVSELLYLIRPSRKWTREEINKFLVDAWQYMEFK